MIIVLEGPDNSGKSTLAQRIAQAVDWPIVPSEGPEKYPGEINERVAKYMARDNMIFDRHPCVSQPIYGKIRHNTAILPDHLDLFYRMKPIFVLCDSQRGLEEHVEKAHDDAAHMAAVRANHDLIKQEYRDWGIKHASIIYRIGDSVVEVVEMVRSVMVVRFMEMPV